MFHAMPRCLEEATFKSSKWLFPRAGISFKDWSFSLELPLFVPLSSLLSLTFLLELKRTESASVWLMQWEALYKYLYTISTIKSRQKKWIGHTLRGDSLLKMVIEGKMLKKDDEEDQDKMMLDCMMVEGYRKLKRRSPTMRGVATSDNWTCLEGREPEEEEKEYTVQ